MSVKKFRFVSPGVFINEIDNSQLPASAVGIGPVVIGRSERGPSMRPVTVTSFSEFVEMFGNPIPGGEGGDIWRDGNRTAPAYGTYAAQAYLRNSSPLTFIRLLGHEHDDATGAGAAGWAMPDAGGAYGLFVGEVVNGQTNENMSLAAVIYSKDGNLGLSGKDAGDAAVTKQLNKLIKLQGTDSECKLEIGGVNYSVNFNTGSKKYIRKVLNCNPTLTNNDITKEEGREVYFLGETFDSFLAANGDATRGASSGFALLVKLNGHSGKLDKGDHEQGAQAPQTGWVLSQHKGSFDDHEVNLTTGNYKSGVTKLFRFEGIDDGAWASSNLKVEISDIKAADDEYNPYGTFTVTLRKASDNDQAPAYVERYTSVNLNPASVDYIARRIGDMRSEWSYTENRYRMLGQYPSLSRFVRVVVNEDIDAGVADPELIPFGFQGPPSPRDVVLSFQAGDGLASLDDGEVQGIQTDVTDDANNAINIGAGESITGGLEATVTLRFPSQACRADSEQGNLSSGDMASFGAMSTTSGAIREDESFCELLKPWSANVSNHDGEATDAGVMITRPSLRGTPYDVSATLVTTAALQADVNEACGVLGGDTSVALHSVPCFTLDDLVMKTFDDGSGVDRPMRQHVEWRPGARRAGASISVLGERLERADGSAWTSVAKKDVSAGTESAEAVGDYKSVLSHGYNSFCLPLVGGTDGIDITHKEPFSEAALADGTPESNYAYNSVKRAIDTIADPEVVECNIAAVPGVCNESLTNHLITVCEARADALAVIDIKGDYQPNTDNIQPERRRLPDVRQAVQGMKDRRINSSYGCAYFPWVQVRDQISDSVLWAPPSVVALGTMSSSQRKTEVWFAPAGFNRGGLTEGSAGLPVPQVRYRLTSKERDALYEANINPIATFPSEGIVIFGQKTLQVTPSALDRINVRRLMIFLKKEVSRIASTILFDPNVETTWQRFTAQVEPFLSSVKSRFGLSEFKVILDETTTTPDLVDRNILYAKIMLKPTRAIEFIALDFVITRSGASFDD